MPPSSLMTLSLPQPAKASIRSPRSGGVTKPKEKVEVELEYLVSPTSRSLASAFASEKAQCVGSSSLHCCRLHAPNTLWSLSLLRVACCRKQALRAPADVVGGSMPSTTFSMKVSPVSEKKSKKKQDGKSSAKSVRVQEPGPMAPKTPQPEPYRPAVITGYTVPLEAPRPQDRNTVWASSALQGLSGSSSAYMGSSRVIVAYSRCVWCGVLLSDRQSSLPSLLQPKRPAAIARQFSPTGVLRLFSPSVLPSHKGHVRASARDSGRRDG